MAGDHRMKLFVLAVPVTSVLREDERRTNATKMRTQRTVLLALLGCLLLLSPAIRASDEDAEDAARDPAGAAGGAAAEVGAGFAGAPGGATTEAAAGAPAAEAVDGAAGVRFFS